MADEPSKKKRRKNVPKLGRGPRGKNQKSRPLIHPDNLDNNPALDNDVVPGPDHDDDHTIIRIGGRGGSDPVVRPAPDDPDPRADPAAADAHVEAAPADPAAADAHVEAAPADNQPAARLFPGGAPVADDAIEENQSGRRARRSSRLATGGAPVAEDAIEDDQSGRRARRSSKRGSRKTSIPDKKKIKSLRNKLSHRTKSLDTAQDRVQELKSEATNLKDKNKELEALEAKAQATAAKANASAEQMSNKLKARVERYSSSREKKEYLFVFYSALHISQDCFYL